MRCRTIVGLTALLTLGAAAPAPAAERWTTRVLAKVGPPGYPAHAYVHPNGRIYEGTYVNGDSRAPSQVLEYTREGQLLQARLVQGQTLDGTQGVQVATSDAAGRLLLLDHTPPRALLMDQAGEQTTYASFPAGTIPNYAAWGPDGSLYVTDYAGNRIWRVPPGGGTPTPWLTDSRFATVEFGMTGLELAADRRTLLFTQQTTPGFGLPVAGGLFAVEIGPDGTPQNLRRVWESRALDLPDGLALAASGRIYVATLGPNQIVTLNADGVEQERFPTTPLTGENGSGTPFDALSSVAFAGTQLITASQSNPQGNADHWAIHEVEAGEPGLAEHIPPTAGPPRPAVERLRVTVSPRRYRAGRTRTFRMRVSAGGEPVQDALVRFAGRMTRTDAAGRARLRVRVSRAGVRTVRVSASSFGAGRTTVRGVAGR